MTISTRLCDFLTMYIDIKYEKISVIYEKREKLRSTITRDEYLRIQNFINLDSSLNYYGLDFNSAF